MAIRIQESDLQPIVEVVRARPNGASVSEIEQLLASDVSRRALQNRLKRLVSTKRLIREGGGRATRYRVPESAVGAKSSVQATVIPISMGGQEVQAYLRIPLESRKPVGFDRAFWDSYQAGVSFNLSSEERAELHRLGRPNIGDEPAGTYARQILDRLLIDLSWSSSRLEGNTYSLLDTRRLLAFSQEADGKQRWEAQMILNHKDAIEFLVDSAGDIGFNRYSILNLHALLASDLLPDPTAPGRLRRIPVGIGGSTYLPLEVPQLIEKCFDQLLTTASAIEDPFEQAFFAMAYLPYLQPFDDVNKRVSRLAASIPLIRTNLCPLSFTDVPREIYNQAMLGVYELCRVDLLKDVFFWAYRRSAHRYAAIRQSLGDPDPFRLRHRTSIRQLVAEVIRGRMDRRAALAHVTSWTQNHIVAGEREQFREVVETELLSISEGNFARFRIKPSEHSAWREVW